MRTRAAAGRSLAVILGLGLGLLAGSAAAQPEPPAHRVPVQIIRARAVLLVNGGGDPLPFLNGGTDRAYTEFVEAMQQWGQYQIVSTPSDADLVIRIRFKVTAVGNGKDAQIIVTTGDPKTNTRLWTLSEHLHYEAYCYWACLDHQFEETLGRVMKDMQALANAP